MYIRVHGTAYLECFGLAALNNNHCQVSHHLYIDNSSFSILNKLRRDLVTPTNLREIQK